MSDVGGQAAAHPGHEVTSGDVRGAAENPYVGPRPFRWDDADLARFHGRADEARRLRDQWLVSRLTVLHGPALSGKTSMLRAGVLPLLAAARDVDLLPIGRLARRSPWPSAERDDERYDRVLLRSWSPIGRQPGADLTIPDLLAARWSRLQASGPARRMLAAVDQFDELFTVFPALETERSRLVEGLSRALREVPALNLLLIVRDDCLDLLEQYEEHFEAVQFVYQPLRLLGVNAAIEAVRSPAERAGCPFADGVAEQLVGRLRTITYTSGPDTSATLRRRQVEPLVLQIVCVALWAALPADRTLITIDDLHAFGDVESALEQFYVAAVHEVHLETGKAADELHAVIDSTFVTEQGTRKIVLRGATATGGVSNQVVDALIVRHILNREQRTASIWHELVDDRMCEAVRSVQRLQWPGPDAHIASGRSGLESPVDFYALAEAALSDGRFTAAHSFAAAAVERQRAVGNARRLARGFALLGGIARAEGDLHAAVENLGAALSQFSIAQDNGKAAKMLAALADVHQSVGDYETAADLFRQAVERMPADVEALTGLGYALWYAGSPGDAEEAFSRALHWDAGATRALAGRGQVRADMREYAHALTDLEQALALGLPPHDEIDARSAHAVVLAALGRSIEADPELAIARSRDPARARTHMRAGRVAALLGRSAQARDELQRALQARPGLPPRDETSVRRLLATLPE